MADSKTKKPLYKRWWFITIMIILFIGIVTPTEEDTTIPVDEISSDQISEISEEPKIEEIETSYPLVVDVPKLINSTLTDAEAVLGPGDMTFHEKLGDVSWTTDQYFIEIQYDPTFEVSTYVWFGYHKDNAPREETFAVSNLEWGSMWYDLELQEWSNPDLAAELNEPEIAGIHVYSK